MKTGLFLIFVGLTISGCRSGHRPVKLFCAASLQDFLSDSLSSTIIPYEAHFGGSVTLLNQAKVGAEVDLLLIADSHLTDILSQSIERSRVIASNRLVLVRNRNLSPADEVPFLGLADPHSAPLGRYTERLLKRKSFTPNSQIVYLKDAKSVISHVALGHCREGIVYRTDALAENRVEIIREFETDRQSPIEYKVVLLKNAPKEAAQVYQLLTSDKANDTLRRLGFNTR